MALQKTKLSDVISVTGVTTVGIFTVGQSTTPVGVTSTSYVKGVVMHNIGIGSVVASLYFYPTGENVLAHGNTAFRMARVDLAESETFFYETNYPITMTGSDQIVVDILPSTNGGSGIGTVVNFQILGDTDIEI
tara:strand:- start:154 stop:555 length:402 start_codon:yes stop_codon:yes gene_type:complete